MTTRLARGVLLLPLLLAGCGAKEPGTPSDPTTPSTSPPPVTTPTTPTTPIATTPTTPTTPSTGADDDDGDGLTNAEESTLGTDPSVSDSDGDSLSDGDEVLLHGTDPLASDTDGDGHADADELADATDPTDRFSFTLDGTWPDASADAVADGVAGTTYGMGQVFPDFQAFDQYGNTVDLYQFYGWIVVLDFGAGWCTPCYYEAPHTQAVWDAYREQGVVVMHLMIEGVTPASAVDQAFLEDWVTAFSLDLPALGGPGVNAAHLGIAPSTGSLIPSVVVLDREMVLRDLWVGAGEDYEPVLDALLAE